MIETKIAEIIDETRFVLAAGKDRGVREGMEFTLYGLGPEIFDPETKESLGKLELVKGRVKVYYVQAKLSHARTRSHSYRRLLLGLLSFPLEVTETFHEKLPIETKSGRYDKELTVRVGDHARSVEVEAELAPHAIAG